MYVGEDTSISSDSENNDECLMTHSCKGCTFFFQKRSIFRTNSNFFSRGVWWTDYQDLSS